jgi:hypothetical protein
LVVANFSGQDGAQPVSPNPHTYFIVCIELRDRAELVYGVQVHFLREHRDGDLQP